MSATITYGEKGCQHVTIGITIDGETRKTVMMRDELFGTQAKDEAFKAELASVCKTASAMAKGEIETPVLDEKTQAITMTKTPTHEQIKAALEGKVIEQDVAEAEVKK